jgi:hypothetical protein
MSFTPQAPVDIKNVGAVLGFVVAVAVAVAVLNRVSFTRKLISA